MPEIEENIESIEKESIPEEPENKKNLILIPIIMIGILAIFGILYWLKVPIIGKLFQGAPTLTSPPPTATTIPTSLPTNTPTPTIPPTPTATPFPASAYQIEELSEIQPPIPGIAERAVVLNEDTSAIASPEFSHPQWVSSSDIGLGVTILEPYYATFGSGAAGWVMDKALEPGLYEIYILDTLYSSGGSLDFTVALGNQAIQPILGQTIVNYQSSYSTPPQTYDQWQSIGVFNVDRMDILSISTSWMNRDEYSIVAIDRALVVRLPESSIPLITSIPNVNQQTYIVDNFNAKIETREFLYSREDLLSWGNEFQFLVNPEENAKFTWQWPAKIPVGTYEVFAWIPAVNGNAAAYYQFFVEGNNLGIDPVSIPHAGQENGSWVSLGTWEIPEVYGNAVNVSMEMNVIAGTAGEIAVDAVAFVKLP